MFSSVLGDAITASLAASMDPMNQIARQMFQGQAQHAEVDLDIKREQFIDSLRTKLQAAKDNGEDAAIVDGYRRLIDKHSGRR